MGGWNAPPDYLLIR